MDVVHRLDGASGAAAGLDHARGVFRIAESVWGAGWALGALFDRRHSPVPPVLALPQLAEACARDFPNLDAHYARMMARPAVKKTIEIEAALGYRLPA